MRRQSRLARIRVEATTPVKPICVIPKQRGRGALDLGIRGRVDRRPGDSAAAVLPGSRGIRLLCAAWLGLLCFAAEGGQSNQSSWDEIYKSNWAGIYTDEQAARGQSSYRSHCASCHGATLEGSDEAPALSGTDFAEDWNCANIADLFEKIQYTMPADRPGRLNEQQVADVLSYILKVNLFPAASHALPTNADELRGLVFFAENPNRL